MKRQLGLVALVVPDYDAGIDYFVGKLRFRMVEDTPRGDGKRWVVVAPGDSGTALLLAKASGPAQQAAIGNQTGGRVGFFLHTDNFDRDYDAFLAVGVSFIEQPRREAYGQVAVFRDAFGNLWDLIEYT